MNLRILNLIFFLIYLTKNENNFLPETFHFFLENSQNTNSSNLIVTCIYPSNQLDEKLGILNLNLN